MKHHGIKIASRLVLCLVICVSVLLLAVPAAAEGPEAIVRLVPALLAPMPVDSTVDVAVQIENVAGLYGMDLRLLFDASVLKVVDADGDTEGLQVQPGTLLASDFVVRNVADNDKGTVWFAITQLNPREPVTGNGTAMVVTFQVLSSGAPGLQLLGATLVSRDGGKLAVALGDEGMSEAAADKLEPTAAPTAAPTATATIVAAQVATETPTRDVTEAPTAEPTQTMVLTDIAVQKAGGGAGYLGPMFVALGAIAASITLWIMRRREKTR